MKVSRGYALFSALLLVAIALGACTPATAVSPTQAPANTQASSEPVVLHIMHNWSPDDPKGPILDEVFAEFEAANPDIDIEVEVFTDLDIPVKVETAFAAGTEPDIVFNNYAGSKQTWIDAGVTIPVNDLMTEWGFDGKFADVALNSATDKQGRLVGFPIEGFTWPVWYNTDIFEAAGVEIPTTVDELLDATEKIRAAGYQPFVTGGTDWSGYAVFTTITQLPMTDEKMQEIYGEGKFGSDPVAQAGIQLFTQLRDAGVFADNTEGLQADAMNEMFFTGEAAMMQAGSWSFGALPEDMQDNVVLGGFPLSDGSPHEKPVIYAGFGKAVWITRNGAQKLDAARRFIQFLFSDQSLLKFIERVGMPSPLLTTQADPTKLSPFLVQSTEYLNDVTVIDITDNYVPQDQFDALYRATADAFIPGTTPDQIAEELDAIYTTQ